MLTDHARTNLGCCRDPILNAQVGKIRLASATVAVRTVALLAGALLLGGCDTLSSLNPFDKTERYKMEIVPEVPAGQLYDEGLGRMKKSDHEGAAKKFGELEKQYPYSDWSRKALLMTAYAHFEGQNYEDAINASKRYLQLHPASTDAPYAQYIMAMSNYNQIPDVTRDQERALKALLALQELVDRYPKSEYVSDARKRSTSPRISSPARRWRSAASICRSATTPPPSTVSATSSPSSRRPGTWKKRSCA